MIQNSLFDLYLGDKATLQGYRCTSFNRDSAPLIAPRFSTGSQGQSDLDLLKSKSVDDFAGGMFQRTWTDPQRVARAIGVYNKSDDKLYPAPPRSSATAITAGYYPVAKVDAELTSFIAYGYFSAGVYYNILHKVTKGGGVTVVTLPAALASNGQANITDLGLHKGYLYVSSQNATANANNYRYDIANNTWQDMTGFGVLMRTMRGILYHINKQSMIYSVTNETAPATTATYTFIDYVGYSEILSVPTSAEEYNGALYISKPDGIYRFDGVRCTKVLPLVTNLLKLFNGALYFVSGQWLYRFDGANVVRLQWFGNAVTGESAGPSSGPSFALASNSDYLFISTVVISSGYTDGDKVPPTASGLHRIYTYDGAAFYLMHESAETLGASYSPGVLVNSTNVYDILGTSASGYQTNRYVFDMTSLFTASAVTSSSKLEITTSEHDDGFPNIFKSAELIELNYTGMIAGDSLVVSYQLFDGKTWGSWVTAGTITSSTDNRLEITDDTKKLSKRIKINATATLAAGSTLALKGASLRYTLQPRVRWRWLVGLNTQGNASGLKDRNNTVITDDSNALTNIVTKSIRQKTPSYMLAPDYGQLSAQVNAAALTFVVKGQIAIYTDPYAEYSLCAVKNNSGVWELLRVVTAVYASGPDTTTITVAERGYLGITAAQLNADAEFHLAYKVYVNRLMRDAVLLDNNTYAQQDSTGESQIKHEFNLEIIEV